DFFKAYNDHYGHVAGDACLRAVAQVLGAHGRRGSDLVARYGGEEFVLLAAATGTADAFGLAEAICAALARQGLPHAQSPLAIVTISIGVAVMPATEDGAPEALLKAADAALYRAKDQGRNQALLSRPAG
uniref:diguanylate cyclase n=1 Tax=Rugamonas sp. TaxID=1926287 RepID=UPI0025E45F20